MLYIAQMKFFSLLTILSAFIHATAAVAQITLTGTINKDNLQESVAFDLLATDGLTDLVLKGSVSTNQGLVYSSDLDFQFVRVQKISEGKRRSFENKGVLTVYPRQRKSGGLVLAGSKVEGSTIQGLVDDGISMGGIQVDGHQSSGTMDYNSITGEYNAKDNLRFGESVISPYQNSGFIFNYDDFGGRNVMRTAMNFGSLSIYGQISFTDSFDPTAGNSVRALDRELVMNIATKGLLGTELNASKVSSTRGEINWVIRSQDGTEAFLPKLSELTETEKDILKLFAFIELTSFDWMAE